MYDFFLYYYHSLKREVDKDISICGKTKKII